MKFKEKLKLRLCVAIVYILIGIALIAVSAAGIAQNETVSSFGAVFACMGIAKVVQYLRITKDESTIRSREIAETDERNIMIMTKARSLTFSIYIILSGIAMVVLYLLNLPFAAQIIAYAICAFALIYFICYHIISRRY